MKHRFIAIVLSFALCSCAGAQVNRTFLSYQGGLDISTSLTISETGQTEVKILRLGADIVTYKTELSDVEFGALKALVESADFFAQQEKDQQDHGMAFIDVGMTVISVNDGDKKKTVTFQFRPSLDPLLQFLWGLASQAEALHALESDGDPYSAMGAVVPSDARMKALQPYRFKQPFMTYAANGKTWHEVEYALEALAWITTPYEFSGFVALQLNKDVGKETILSIIGTPPFYGNIPDSHFKSLCPIYLRFVREYQSRMDTLTESEERLFYLFTNLLGENRYQAALPFFLQWFDESNYPYIDAYMVPVAQMGLSGLRALLPYLGNENEHRRLNSIELIVIASRQNPRSKSSNPLSDYEYLQMIPIFTNEVLPKLRVMLLDDPSQVVREKAAEAIAEIESEIRK